MNEPNGWLKVVIEQMQDDMTEMKADIKQLLEARAETRGKTYVIVGIITIAINLAAILLRA